MNLKTASLKTEVLILPLSLYHLENSQGFRSSVPGMRGKSNICFYLFLNILFTFRERGKEGEREGEKHQRVVASHTPSHWGPSLQPSYVP